MIAATGRREAYYGDYLGTPQEFVSLARSRLPLSGPVEPAAGEAAGHRPTWGLEPAAFVNYLQNHDQVANSARGERFHRLTDPGRYRALTALFLLVPATPMLFQGQEFAASSPFFYFGDHKPELAEQMYRGRQDFLSQFPSLATARDEGADPPARRPGDLRALEARPGRAGAGRHAEAYALHRDLLRLRRDDPVFGDRRRGRLEGAVLGPGAFVLRYFGAEGTTACCWSTSGRDWT